MIDFEKIKKDCEKIARETEEQEVEKLKNNGFRFIIKDGNKTVGFLYDSCGMAIIKFKDKRSAFYKSYKKYMKEDSDIFRMYPPSARQEISVNKAIAYNICEYLNNNFNAKVYVKFWYD